MNKTFESAMTAIEHIEDSLKASKKARKSGFHTLLLLFAFVMVSLSAQAAPKSSADAASKKIADSEYLRGNYHQAIKDYNEILKRGVSADIYYNLGNSYYRTDNLTQAILAYERAYLLAPGDADIRFNLQFASSKTIDKITPINEMFFVTWYHSLVNFKTIHFLVKKDKYIVIIMIDKEFKKYNLKIIDISKMFPSGDLYQNLLVKHEFPSLIRIPSVYG